jgi:hypothetical protein
LCFTAASAGSAPTQPHRDVAGSAVELSLRAEQLKGAAAALVIADRGFSAQRAQAIAAIFSERDHAALVDRIPR